MPDPELFGTLSIFLGAHVGRAVIIAASWYDIEARQLWMFDQTMAEEIGKREIDTELEGLRAAHRAMDDLIRQLAAEGSGDQLHVQRLKRRKLMLKDRITAMENERIPDIIA